MLVPIKWFFFFLQEYSTRAHTTRFRYGSAQLDLDPDWARTTRTTQTTRLSSGSHDSTSTRACTTRRRPGPARLDVDPGSHNSTSTRAHTIQHHPGLEDSTLTRTHTTRLQLEHKPVGLDFGPDVDQISHNSTSAGPTWLDIGTGPHDSTSTQARTTQRRPGPGPARLDLDPTRRWPRLGLAQLDFDLGPTTRHRLKPRPVRLDINTSPHDSMSTRTRMKRFRPKHNSTLARACSTWPCRARTTRPLPDHEELDLSPSPDDSTSTWARTTPTRPQMTQPPPDPEGLDLGLRLDHSTSARARTTRHRHRPEPGQLDIGPGRDDSTRLGLTLLDIGLGPNDSTSAQAETTRHLPGLGWLDISPCPGDSTLARARACLSRHQAGPTRLDFGPCLLNGPETGRLDMEPTWLNLGSGPLDPTSIHTCSARHRARLAQNQPWPCRLDMSSGPLIWISTRLWPEMTWLDFGPYQLNSIWAQTTQLNVEFGRLCSTLAWIYLDQTK